MQNDVTLVSFCLTTFHKEKQLYTTIFFKHTYKILQAREKGNPSSRVAVKVIELRKQVKKDLTLMELKVIKFDQILQKNNNKNFFKDFKTNIEVSLINWETR